MADLPKVMVGMSGGVDSSVSALLLQRQGYPVAGLFMKNWDEDDGTEYCTAKRDLADAQAVCDHLGIELHTANFAAEYWDGVFEHFLSEYAAGRTPNPDILCNREIKFKVFLQYAKHLGAQLIATGHYARTRAAGGAVELLKGCDPGKDQTYFLHAVGGSQLATTLFPVGDLPKAEVRQLAAGAGLVTQSKRDSTGICFIGERRFKDFLERYLPAQPGLIETPSGEVLGEHSGLMYHTIGQRQGLGIGGRRGGGGEPWYVADKDLDRNVLVVVQGSDDPLLFSRSLRTGPCNFIGEPPPPEFRAAAKVRYRQADQPCAVRWGSNGAEVVFDQPQRAVTPGQSVVWYWGERCLGGAVIEARSA